MLNHSFIVVIPARFGATRLPGKPLIYISGRPMIQHVWERACRSHAQHIIIATDDMRIATACRAFGAEVAMTSKHHRSGTDRIAEVSDQYGWADDTLIVNLQGDEPCIAPSLLDQVAAILAEHSEVNMATLCYPLANTQQLFDRNVVKVVINAHGQALYFSRAPIPWQRDAFHSFDQSSLPSQLPINTEFLRHIGLYAYRAGFLRRYVKWPPVALEQAEALEQLRVLYYGERIQVAMAIEQPGRGVDTPQDLIAVQQLLGD
ncbi:3-deoxy-manno-octulosonate cytidylyltransferase [Rhodoferax sp. 4810]|uniref:3-deoxy-manno-octulosonate cytidylyltransferase n=1 Tax=Thiospirillum jenense TaxID=1653858 RepID=A0A839HAA0_9GAMM|nr:3-deoxy-manno-octulosonate cytidylyltransferase [Thiospirillum jenense]MBB1074206.1 3-deoxy-manno-octulosonate cytidylyltransferase [Rhodoferax jenense]MBB1125280.1 3-deoxy-manno-octulosonate cytidylyltransferase [Thiospirillum jenense]